MGIIHKLLTVSALLVSLSAEALVLSASPLESEADAQRIYAPVAELLSDALGVEVVFEYGADWLTFSRKLIASDYDLILSEPHIAAYASSKTSVLSMNVISRLPGELKYHVIVSQDNAANNLQDLQSSQICMLPSPNYSGVLIMKEFTNPVVQPSVVQVQGNDDKIFSYFKKGRCAAAVINDLNYQRLLTAGEQIKSIYTTVTSPNFGLTVSQRIPQADRELINNALQDPANADRLNVLYSTYSAGQSPFVSTDSAAYQPFNILPGVVWGW